MSEKITYTTVGEVCGPCGHQHRSIRTALECLDRCRRACQSRHGQGVYLDRYVVRGDGSPLESWERDELV